MNGERQRTPRGWARLVKPTGLSPVLSRPLPAFMIDPQIAQIFADYFL